MTDPRSQDQPPPRGKARRSRKKRSKKFRIVFRNGRQVRVPLDDMVEGMPVEEFILRNAGPIFLHENELWQSLQPPPTAD